MTSALKLRPTFYRTPEQPDLRSGWINIATGDIYDSRDGRSYELVPRGRPTLLLHQRVRFAVAVDLHPADLIEEDECGVVSHVNTSGTVSIMLEGLHNGLDSNTLALTPFIDDETLIALEVLEMHSVSFSSPMQGKRPRRHTRGLLMGLVGAVTFVAGWTVDPPLSVAAVHQAMVAVFLGAL